jgi:hypothetical protein
MASTTTNTDPSLGPYPLIPTPYHTHGKVCTSTSTSMKSISPFSPGRTLNLHPQLTPAQLPQHRIPTEMALAHNAYIRSLNAIYIQATSPLLSPSDPANHKTISDFLTYSQTWYEAVHHHHDAEESFFFPLLESVTASPGLMAINVEQHAAFFTQLEKWGERTYTITPEEFNGEEWRKGIESFAEPLVKHLTEEIGTLEALVSFDADGSKLGKHWDAFDAKVVGEADKFRLFPLVLGAVDTAFEGGIHHWPPIPFFVPYLVDWVFARRHRGAWRFGPSDVYGKPRALQFLPKE